MLNPRAGQGRAGKVDGQIVKALDIESKKSLSSAWPHLCLVFLGRNINCYSAFHHQGEERSTKKLKCWETITCGNGATGITSLCHQKGDGLFHLLNRYQSRKQA